MLYLANPCGEASIDAMRDRLLGFIDTPAQGNKRPPDLVWAADNGCFGRGYPGDEAWLAWLRRNRDNAERCLFATAPDVVGDAAATLQRSRPFLRPVRELGYPVALVAQNGLENLPVPWDEFDALFIGGSLECLSCQFIWPSDQQPARNQACPHCDLVLSEWKLGRGAAYLVDEANGHGKYVHMGRVNSLKRYRYAVSIGCDSVDGTYLTRAPRINLPRLLGWVDTIRSEAAASERAAA